MIHFAFLRALILSHDWEKRSTKAPGCLVRKKQNKKDSFTRTIVRFFELNYLRLLTLCAVTLNNLQWEKFRTPYIFVIHKKSVLAFGLQVWERSQVSRTSKRAWATKMEWDEPIPVFRTELVRSVKINKIECCLWTRGYQLLYYLIYPYHKQLVSLTLLWILTRLTL